MSASRGPFVYLYAFTCTLYLTIWRSTLIRKILHQMMMEYSIRKVTFINFIAPNSFENVIVYFLYLTLSSV